MKGIIISLTAAVSTLLLSMGSVTLMFNILGKNTPEKKTKITWTLIVWAILFFGGGLVYFNIYFHCDEKAMQMLESSETVQVSEINRAYYFDGPGEDAVLVVYPGAKVDEKAYAPLCHLLAEKGMDCILVMMPLHMAFTEKEAFARFPATYNYEEWYIGGHSLGGAMAAIYAAQHPEQIDGVVLLGSYPSLQLSDMKLCSIYGEFDYVMQKNVYDSSMEFWPVGANELVIKGGNHSYFGNYGLQRGDGEATISREEQQEITADFIVECMLQ